MMVNRERDGATAGNTAKRGRGRGRGGGRPPKSTSGNSKDSDKELEKFKRVIKKHEKELVEKTLLITGLQAEITRLKDELYTRDEILKKLELQMSHESQEAELQIIELKGELLRVRSQKDTYNSGSVDQNAGIAELHRLLAQEKEKSQRLQETQSKTLNMISRLQNLISSTSHQSQFPNMFQNLGINPSLDLHHHSGEGHPHIASWTSVSLADHQASSSSSEASDFGSIPVITRVESLCTGESHLEQMQEKPALKYEKLASLLQENSRAENDPVTSVHLGLPTSSENTVSPSSSLPEALQVSSLANFPDACTVYKPGVSILGKSASLGSSPTVDITQSDEDCGTISGASGLENDHLNVADTKVARDENMFKECHKVDNRTNPVIIEERGWDVNEVASKDCANDCPILKKHLESGPDKQILYRKNPAEDDAKAGNVQKEVAMEVNVDVDDEQNGAARVVSDLKSVEISAEAKSENVLGSKSDVEQASQRLEVLKKEDDGNQQGGWSTDDDDATMATEDVHEKLDRSSNATETGDGRSELAKSDVSGGGPEPSEDSNNKEQNSTSSVDKDGKQNPTSQTPHQAKVNFMIFRPKLLSELDQMGKSPGSPEMPDMVRLSPVSSPVASPKRLVANSRPVVKSGLALSPKNSTILPSSSVLKNPGTCNLSMLAAAATSAPDSKPHSKDSYTTIFPPALKSQLIGEPSIKIIDNNSVVSSSIISSVASPKLPKANLRPAVKAVLARPLSPAWSAPMKHNLTVLTFNKDSKVDSLKDGPITINRVPKSQRIEEMIIEKTVEVRSSNNNTGKRPSTRLKSYINPNLKKHVSPARQSVNDSEKPTTPVGPSPTSKQQQKSPASRNLFQEIKNIEKSKNFEEMEECVITVSPKSRHGHCHTSEQSESVTKSVNDERPPFCPTTSASDPGPSEVVTEKSVSMIPTTVADLESPTPSPRRPITRDVSGSLACPTKKKKPIVVTMRSIDAASIYEAWKKREENVSGGENTVSENVQATSRLETEKDARLGETGGKTEAKWSEESVASTLPGSGGKEMRAGSNEGSDSEDYGQAVVKLEKDTEDLDQVVETLDENVELAGQTCMKVEESCTEELFLEENKDLKSKKVEANDERVRVLESDATSATLDEVAAVLDAMSGALGQGQEELLTYKTEGDSESDTASETSGLGTKDLPTEMTASESPAMEERGPELRSSPRRVRRIHVLGHDVDVPERSSKGNAELPGRYVILDKSCRNSGKDTCMSEINQHLCEILNRNKRNVNTGKSPASVTSRVHPDPSKMPRLSVVLERLTPAQLKFYMSPSTKPSLQNINEKNEISEADKVDGKPNLAHLGESTCSNDLHILPVKEMNKELTDTVKPSLTSSGSSCRFSKSEGEVPSGTNDTSVSVLSPPSTAGIGMSSGSPRDTSFRTEEKPVISPAKEVISPAKAVISPAKAVISPAKAVISPAKAVISPAKAVISPAKAVISPAKATSWKRFEDQIKKDTDRLSNVLLRRVKRRLDDKDEEYQKRLSVAELCLCPHASMTCGPETPPVDDDANLATSTSQGSEVAADFHSSESPSSSSATELRHQNKRRRIAMTSVKGPDSAEKDGRTDGQETAVGDDGDLNGVPMSAVEELLDEMSYSRPGKESVETDIAISPIDVDDDISQYFKPIEYEGFSEAYRRRLKNIKANYMAMIQYGLPVETPHFMKSKHPSLPWVVSFPPVQSDRALPCPLCAPRKRPIVCKDNLELVKHIYDEHREMDPEEFMRGLEGAVLDNTNLRIVKLKSTDGINSANLDERKISNSNSNSNAEIVCVDNADLDEQKISNINAEIVLSKVTFECAVCKKQFYTRSALCKHADVHANVIHCEFEGCGKMFHDKEKLQLHMLAHRRERCYRCGICNKAFAGRWWVQLHMGSHAKEKPFVCTVCTASFADRDCFDKHLLAHKGRQYYCHFRGCHSAFISKPDLKEHYQMHYMNKYSKT